MTPRQETPSEPASLDMLAREALSRPDSDPAIEFKGRWFTWGDLRRIAAALKAAIAASGASPRTPIAFAPHNRPAALAALVGLIAEKRNICMIYAYQSKAGIARDVLRLDAPVLVADAADCVEDVRDMAREHGVALIGLSEMDAAPIAGFEHATRQSPDAEGEARIDILTSGTTGPPKQFPLRYDLIARHYLGFNLFQQTPEKQPPALLYFPLGNISGIYTTVPTLLSGQRVVLLERFTVEGWRDHLVRYRPRRSGLPPAGYQMVLDANIPREELSCIESMGAGAAPLDPTVHRTFEDHYGVPILLSYGATEFGGPVTAWTPALYQEWREKKFGSVGKPIPGAQLRVVDIETGAPLPPGQEGILEVISPRIGPDWIHTSDIALIDEDGFIFHRGRADGAIMRGGFKLLPETIERALLLHPAVAAAGVIGIADRRLGQTPAAAIEVKPAAPTPDIVELEIHLRQHVPATHIPTQWRIVESLPRTPSVKTDRPALRALFNTK